jgi:mannose-1-phosphate guanylyltransferase
VARGATICKTGRWVTFGITSTKLAMTYGYIEVANTKTQFADLKSFTQKPDISDFNGYAVDCLKGQVSCN